LVQLEEWRPRFEALGVKVAGMTYDRHELLASFHDEAGLGYPLLQDVDVYYVNALGVRNEGYAEGDSGYGVPHPGILWIGADGRVRAKFAVPGYRARPSFAEVLETVGATAGPSGPG
jgi:peroxiredoxin